MGAMASQITSLTIVYSAVYSGAGQRKHQSSASLAFVRGIHRWPVNSPHKGPVTRKMFPFDDVIMRCGFVWAAFTHTHHNRMTWLLPETSTYHSWLVRTLFQTYGEWNHMDLVGSIMQTESKTWQNRVHVSRNTYSDVIMNAMASQITCASMVRSTLCSGADTSSSASLAWHWWGEFTGERWIPLTKGQQRGKCFDLMTSSWYFTTQYSAVLLYRC